MLSRSQSKTVYIHSWILKNPANAIRCRLALLFSSCFCYMLFHSSDWLWFVAHPWHKTRTSYTRTESRENETHSRMYELKYNTRIHVYIIQYTYIRIHNTIHTRIYDILYLLLRTCRYAKAKALREVCGCSPFETALYYRCEGSDIYGLSLYTTSIYVVSILYVLVCTRHFPYEVREAFRRAFMHSWPAEQFHCYYYRVKGLYIIFYATLLAQYLQWS